MFYFLNPFCLFINTDSIMYLIPEEPILLPWKTCCECYAFASVYVFSSAENVSVACLSTVAACTAILINHQFQGNPAEVLGRHNTFCHTCYTQLEHVLFFSLKISFLFHITQALLLQCGYNFYILKCGNKISMSFFLFGLQIHLYSRYSNLSQCFFFLTLFESRTLTFTLCHSQTSGISAVPLGGCSQVK